MSNTVAGILVFIVTGAICFGAIWLGEVAQPRWLKEWETDERIRRRYQRNDK